MAQLHSARSPLNWNQTRQLQSPTSWLRLLGPGKENGSAWPQHAMPASIHLCIHPMRWRSLVEPVRALDLLCPWEEHERCSEGKRIHATRSHPTARSQSQLSGGADGNAQLKQLCQLQVLFAARVWYQQPHGDQVTGNILEMMEITV